MRGQGLFWAGMWIAAAAQCVCAATGNTGIPLYFEQNRGQADSHYPSHYPYVARSEGFTLLLSSADALLAIPNGEPLGIRLEGSDSHARMEPLDPLPSR